MNEMILCDVNWLIGRMVDSNAEFL